MATENADNIKLREAITRVSNLKPDSKVKIHNKYYATVKLRNQIFREYFGTDASYVSKVEFRDPIFHNDKMIFAGSVVATTELWIKKNMIAVGIAEEIRNSSPVNKTSATENAMTSSLGICLARAGLDGGEFASADEMQIATRNGLAIDELNNLVLRDTSQKEDQDSIISPPKINTDQPSVEVSLSDFTSISNSIDKVKHLGQLRATYTKNKDAIDGNEQLQAIYQTKEEDLSLNKPKEDGWL